MFPRRWVRGAKGANGIRVPASDLERLVVEGVGNQLLNPVRLSHQFGSDLGPAQMQRLFKAAEQLQTRLAPCSNTAASATIRSLIERVVVDAAQVRISLDQAAFVQALADCDRALDLPATPDAPLVICVEARTLRCGKQVRLILGATESTILAPDADLLKLVTDARRWFDDLRSGRVGTIAEIARRDRQQVSHVSRTIGLAFLAPDIVEMILAGRQPITLTSERLKASRPLPLAWGEQRELLLG